MSRSMGELSVASAVSARAALRGERTVPSEFEVAILTLVAEGYSSTQVARRLGVHEEKVKVHLKYLFAIAAVHSRPALVAWAFRRGFLA